MRPLWRAPYDDGRWDMPGAVVAEHQCILNQLAQGVTYTVLAKALGVTVMWLRGCEAEAIESLPVMEGV